jgi:CLIP-associating protein 1/2
VELFTGPGVSDAARADLKKEMTKKAVRKNIVDAVLAKLVAGGTSTGNGLQSDGSENGDTGSNGAKKEYIPPSLALQGRKPTVTITTGASSGGMPRSVSQGNVKEPPRPASQTAMSPPLPTPTENAGNEVHPVYVSFSYIVSRCKLSNSCFRSHRPETWKPSLQAC